MQQIINQGSRSVAIVSNDATGPFAARLYVNCAGPRTIDLGDATLVARKFSTLKGAVAWARKALADAGAVVCYDDLPSRATAIEVRRGDAFGPLVARFPVTAAGAAAARRLAEVR